MTEHLMFDEELPKKKSVEFPRNIEDFSVSDLRDYIVELENEIARVKEDIDKKNKSQDAAASVFKF
ncbi:MAG: DUF1192 domain-containing protein [Alphaproteobacteria bacterium]